MMGGGAGEQETSNEARETYLSYRGHGELEGDAGDRVAELLHLLIEVLILLESRSAVASHQSVHLDCATRLLVW